MTSDERRKLEQQLKSNGAKQSTQDPNKWKQGNSCFKFEGNNTLNNDGAKTHGFSNSKKRID